jgi:pyridoxal phosphate enzyme (YggS family)
MSPIRGNLQAVLRRIEDAARAAQRPPHDIRLLAVSKTWPADAIAEAHRAGQSAFGESQVQEATAKIAALQQYGLEWHFIGPIQSNKTRPIAEHFEWVHSIDREKVALRLSQQRPAGHPPLMVCIEVNVSGEPTKAGVSPAQALALAEAVAKLPRLQLRGLMTVPAPSPDPARQRGQFAALRDLFERLRAAGLPLDTLSMGMSDDLEAAIAGSRDRRGGDDRARRQRDLRAPGWWPNAAHRAAGMTRRARCGRNAGHAAPSLDPLPDAALARWTHYMRSAHPRP